MQVSFRLGTVGPPLWKSKILRGVYPERDSSGASLLQNDERRTQNDIFGDFRLFQQRVRSGQKSFFRLCLAVKRQKIYDLLRALRLCPRYGNSRVRLSVALFLAIAVNVFAIPLRADLSFKKLVLQYPKSRNRQAFLHLPARGKSFLIKIVGATQRKFPGTYHNLSY